MKSYRWVLLVSGLALFALSPIRGLAQEHKFNNDDRKAAQDYHDQHQSKPAAGFRAQDRLRPEDDAKIRQGAIVDADLRKRSHPVPADLLHRLAPPPHGYRYVVIGGHVCEVDSGWHISDVINITL